MPTSDDERVKEAVKEAFKEWMDEKYLLVGKWTVSAFMVTLFGALVYLTIIAAGWHK